MSISGARTLSRLVLVLGLASCLAGGILLGWLWVWEPERSVRDQLRGVVAPPPTAALAGALLLALVGLLLVVLALSPGLPRLLRRRLRAVAVIACVALAATWVSATWATARDSLWSGQPTPAIEHSVAPTAEEGPARREVTPSSGTWEASWRLVAGPYRRALLVPGEDLVVTFAVEDGKAGVAVLDAESGDERWRFLAEVFVAGIVADPFTDTVAVLSEDTAVALDLHSGDRLWSLALPEIAGDEDDDPMGWAPLDRPQLERRHRVDVAPVLAHPLGVVPLGARPLAFDDDSRGLALLHLRRRAVEVLDDAPRPSCHDTAIRSPRDVETFLVFRTGAGCDEEMWQLVLGRVQHRFPLPPGPDRVCAVGCRLTDAVGTARGVALVRHPSMGEFAQGIPVTVLETHGTPRIAWEGRGHGDLHRVGVYGDRDLVWAGGSRFRFANHPSALVRRHPEPWPEVVDVSERDRETGARLWFVADGSRLRIFAVSDLGEGAPASEPVAVVPTGCAGRVTAVSVSDGRVLVDCGGTPGIHDYVLLDHRAS